MLTHAVLMTPTPVTLPVGGVNSDSIVIVKSISGLTPAALTLFTGDFAGSGGYYKGRRVGKRNPVFNLKLNPDYKNDIEVSDIREMLYEWFLGGTDDGDGLQVVLKDDRKPDRTFLGFTETLDPDMFARDTNAMISMIVVDPFLTSTTSTTASDAGGWLSRAIAYEGSAPTGLQLKIKVLEATVNVRLAIGNQTMLFRGPFVAGDIIEVNTSEGSRYIRKNHVDAMAALLGGPSWIELRKGNNLLQAYGDVPGDGLAAVLQYTYRAAWWGV